MFIKAAQLVNIEPEKCVVFEDAEAGIDAAIAANIKTIGIGSPEILNKANVVINNLEEINYKKIVSLLKN